MNTANAQTIIAAIENLNGIWKENSNALLAETLTGETANPEASYVRLLSELLALASK